MGERDRLDGSSRNQLTSGIYWTGIHLAKSFLSMYLTSATKFILSVKFERINWNSLSLNLQRNAVYMFDLFVSILSQENLLASRLEVSNRFTSSRTLQFMNWDFLLSPSYLVTNCNGGTNSSTYKHLNTISIETLQNRFFANFLAHHKLLEVQNSKIL